MNAEPRPPPHRLATEVDSIRDRLQRPCRAAVLIPTHDHALMLPLSIASAQAQTLDDVLIVVIGDGIGDDTRDALAPILAADERVVAVDLPKRGRTGEPHRHDVLAAMVAPVVTYLSDDDLLLVNHVEQMCDLLAGADFAHPYPVHIDEHGALHCDPVDLSVPTNAELEFRQSLVSLTGIAHTLAAYRRLPYGWRSTPAGTYTDQYMIQQYLAQPWCRAVACTRPTVVRLPASLRREMTAEQRLDELQMWADRMGDPHGRAEFVESCDAASRRAAATWRGHAEALSVHHARQRVELDDALRRIGTLESALDHTTATVTALESALDHATASLTELEARLAAEMSSRESVESEAIAAMERCAQLTAELGVVRADRDAILHTRTMRTRAVLTKSRVLRVALARRRGAS